MMFIFASNLVLVSDMIDNLMVRTHADLVIKTLNDIIILLTKSFISEKDKEKLVELGKQHYHFGIKKEYFKVYCLFKLLFFSNLNAYYV
jgi:hypothetical protein